MTVVALVEICARLSAIRAELAIRGPSDPALDLVAEFATLIRRRNALLAVNASR